jgi:hypothetical protein
VAAQLPATRQSELHVDFESHETSHCAPLQSTEHIAPLSHDASHDGSPV